MKLVSGVGVFVAVVISTVLISVFFNIIRNLRKKASKDASCDVEMRIRSPERQVMCGSDWSFDGEINGGDDDYDHSCNVRCVASDTRGALRLREIEEATNGLAIENMIGTGEFGVVYHGLFMDHTRAAIKNLFSNRRGEKEFCSLAEAMMLIRHKNLVKLLGYCAEGPYRMVVYEYVENGNLEHWLHNCISKISPLTWSIRMRIIIGIARGLAYLHDETDPPVAHFNLKSSNVLIDEHWNPKISNIGTTKLLGPEYDFCSHKVDEKSDVYNFGVLIMEIVSGKTPIQTYGNEIE
ncbi:hypothetical protein ACS0TY_004581 [Phlomoides rotata]